MSEIKRRWFVGQMFLSFLYVLISSFIKPKKNSEAIGCAPDSVEHIEATKTSVASGNWSSGSTWSGGTAPTAGDTVTIAAGHTVVPDTTITVQSITINEGGVLNFNPAISATINAENIINYGGIVSHPATASVVHYIKIINIDENAFVGTGAAPSFVASDKGVWVLGNGYLDLQGTAKTSWTELATAASIGNTTVTVKNASGWQVGDEIVIATMDRPLRTDQEGYYLDWDDATQSPTDNFLPRNERRTIIAISGNVVTIAALTYNHPVLVTSIGGTSKTFYPEVENITRNIKISGVDNKHRTHVFIMNNVPNNIQYVQIWYTGPRNVQTGQDRPQVVLGRYGLHFHHCNDGSIGTQVIGCAIYDSGGRCYVPHASNGITFRYNVVWNTQDQAYWYDFNQPTHFLTFEYNLCIGARNNGVSRGNTGFELGQGDGNICRFNRMVYVSAYETHSNSGCWSWGADNEGVWIFEDNLSHSSLAGIQVWQNTSNNHTVINYTAFNCDEAISHGAYGNSYTYLNGYIVNSKILVTATSGNVEGVVFDGYLVDTGGDESCFIFQDSPIPSDPLHTNKVRNSTLQNYTLAAVQICTVKEDSNVEKQFKCVDMIQCVCSGTEAVLIDTTNPSKTPYPYYPLKVGNKIRVQRVDGTAFQYEKLSSGVVYTASIPTFAPQKYGKGGGLKADYFNGIGLDINKFAFTRIDTMVKFQQWSYNYGASPNQVHHLITGDETGYAYSIRETGFIKSQYDGDYTITLYGGGSVRMWLNGTKIIDNWNDNKSSKDAIISSPVTLNSLYFYPVIIEHKHPFYENSRGFEFFWKHPSMPIPSEVPMQQLYATNPNNACTI